MIILREPDDPLEFLECGHGGFVRVPFVPNLYQRLLHGARGHREERQRIRHHLETHVLQLLGRAYGRGSAPFEHVRHLRDARRDFAKRLHLFSGSERVDEERVGAGVGERSDAPQRLIEGFCATRVAPREDDDIPAAAFVAFVARGANARHGFRARQHAAITRVAARFGRHLILHEDARETRVGVAANRALRVHRVTVAVIRIAWRVMRDEGEIRRSAGRRTRVGRSSLFGR